jgi:hypothetical protein
MATPSSELQAYMTRMRAAVVQIGSERRRAEGAFLLYDAVGSQNDLSSLLKLVQKKAALAAATAARVKPVRSMRGPHATIVAAVRSLATEAGKAAAKVDAADTSTSLDIDLVRIDIDSARSSTAEREAYWRDELVVQLRRLRVTVPLWVKQAGK